MRETPGDTFRRLAAAMLDAAEAADRDGIVPATTALTQALDGAEYDIDPDALLSSTLVGIFIASLACGITARETLDTLYRSCG